MKLQKFAFPRQIDRNFFAISHFSVNLTKFIALPMEQKYCGTKFYVKLTEKVLQYTVERHVKYMNI